MHDSTGSSHDLPSLHVVVDGVVDGVVVVVVVGIINDSSESAILASREVSLVASGRNIHLRGKTIRRTNFVRVRSVRARTTARPSRNITGCAHQYQTAAVCMCGTLMATCEHGVRTNACVSPSWIMGRRKGLRHQRPHVRQTGVLGCREEAQLLSLLQ